jgi:hypothetical protein
MHSLIQIDLARVLAGEKPGPISEPRAPRGARHWWSLRWSTT